MFMMFPSPPARHRHINICTLVICLLLVILGGCTRNYDGGFNIPFVYKIDIQQGNVVDQNMVDKLQKGMDKTRVRFIMGTPVLVDPFHSNRWEYIFSYQAGGKKREQRHISLHFEDEKLAYIEGDVETTRLQRPREGLKEGKSIVVPSSYGKKKGFFGRMTDKVTPWGKETPQDAEPESVNAEPQIEDEADSQVEQQEETSPEPEYESDYVETQIEELKVPVPIANLSATFGSTIGQNGCAGICVLLPTTLSVVDGNLLHDLFAHESSALTSATRPVPCLPCRFVSCR